jgi:hypothetical protein
MIQRTENIEYFRCQFSLQGVRIFYSSFGDCRLSEDHDLSMIFYFRNRIRQLEKRSEKSHYLARRLLLLYCMDEKNTEGGKMKGEENIGQHVFEVAGLGRAPFAFVSYEYKTYQASPDSPIQAGGSCDYCGAAIVNFCWVRDADGKLFKVGPDCIAKVGDKGIIESFKKSREYRQHQRDQREARAAVKINSCRSLLADANVRAKLAANPHPNQWQRDKGASRLDWAEWMLLNAGTKGKLEVAAYVAAIN